MQSPSQRPDVTGEPLPGPESDSLQAIAAQYDRVALVLQGGGALGAYQAGVYEALAEAGIAPSWLTGVSIGSVNAAIIAGNPPERRVDRLREFWELISGREELLWYWPDGDHFRALRNQFASLQAMVLGQPGFFKPRVPNPWLRARGAYGATSFYSSKPARETLLRLVDFDLINSGQIRLAVGAVNVKNGNFVYFHNTNGHKIGPEHIMASGALPPALPAVEIDGELYWDGGIVSNTPLSYLLEFQQSMSTLAFQVDLFSARGPLPRDMRDVMARHKDILYSSRTRLATDTIRRFHHFKRAALKSLAKLPPELRTAEDEELLEQLKDTPSINIAHLIYQPQNYESDAKDYEFSAVSMRDHWKVGLTDTRRTLHRRDWLVMPAEGRDVVVHDLHRDYDR